MLGRLLPAVLLLGALLLTPAAFAGKKEEETFEDKVRNDPDALVYPPRAGEKPNAHGPVYAMGKVLEVKNAEEALKELSKAVMFTPPSIRLKAWEGMKSEEIVAIKARINDTRGVTCTEVSLVNDDLLLRLKYDERVRVMSLYRRFVDARETAWYYKGPLFTEVMKELLEKRARQGGRRNKVNVRTDAMLDKKDLPRFSNLRDLGCYIISAMPYCPQHIRAIVESEIDDKESDVLALAAGAHSKWMGHPDYASMSGSTSSGKDIVYHMNFCYSEVPLLVAAYQGYLDKEDMDDKFKRALDVVTKRVDKIKAQHKRDYNRAMAVHDAIVRSTSYKRCSTDTPCEDLFIKRRANCHGYAFANNAMLKMLGLDTHFITGDTNGSTDEHSWNLLYLDGVWAHVDLTGDDSQMVGWRTTRHDSFLITDAQKREKNKWKKIDYPPCTDDCMNIDKKFAAEFATVEEMVSTLLAKRETAPCAVLLEGKVRELSTRPDRAERLVEQALDKLGESRTIEVDYTPRGDASLRCE